tara:strand:- start:1084 stop:1266 length:183 start_codon:yes stop_codon:yes gene_type:complete
MFEKLNFQGKLWRVLAKIEANKIDDPSKLKESYGCDMVIKSNQNVFFILDEIIDVDYEDI